MTDTSDRSLEHWSEAKRSEMDAFYALATADYRHLAEARNWRAWLEARQAAVGGRPLRLLDVACGSGKFPTALRAHAGVAEAAIRPIAYSLLDPSAFSLAEARAALGPPFEAAEDILSTLEDYTPTEPFDVVWATHALYAVPAADLDAAMGRFGTATGGVGFIAHAAADSHYIRFYTAFLAAFHGGRGEPYRTAEEIVDALRRAGAQVETQHISYTQSATDPAIVEGYLQRCAFDDTVSLDSMRRTEPLAGYLAGCRTGDAWTFDQTVALIAVTA